MKILHVSASFFPAYFYGGPTRSVYALCRQLGQLGNDVRVLTTNANGPEVVNGGGTHALDELTVHYSARWLKPDVAPGLLVNLPAMVRWADVVHITGVFSYPTPPALLTAMLLDRPAVWSPRGSLQPWGLARRPGLKRTWLRLLKAVSPDRLAIHVTTEEERAFTAQVLPDVRQCIISNGVDVPDQVARPPRSPVLRLLMLGRLHEMKAIENMLAALPLLDNVTLSLAGDGEAEYVRGLRSEVERLGLTDRVHFLGQVIDEQKARALAEADVLMMPSHNENFAMAVAEGLAHGLPVIASHQTPWPRLEAMGCGLWVPNDAISLADAVRRIRDMPLEEMGARGRAWMQAEYGWRGRAVEMLAVYQGLLGRRPALSHSGAAA